ncbi:MAG: hypothetical protein AAF487_09465 [Bacteroidota bacterium]
MNKYFFFLSFLLILGCSQPIKPDNAVADSKELHSNSISKNELYYESRVDSIIYQNLFEWKDKWVGIAQPVNDEIGKRGLRLQLLKMKPDSSMQLISESSYGYDSRIFYPSFFEIADRTFLLVNTGERESWGNKVIELKDTSFVELGFIDAAILEENVKGEEYAYRHENIAKAANLIAQNGNISFQFVGDSLIIFDDGKGGYDRKLSCDELTYSISGMQLIMRTKD